MASRVERLAIAGAVAVAGAGVLLVIVAPPGLLTRFVAYWCFVVAFVVCCVIAALRGRRFVYRHGDWLEPANQYTPDGHDASKYNIRLDTHFHTTHSDGVMGVEEGILWHLATGFNAFFITDHDTLSNAADVARLREKYRDRILVMQGLEITTERGHVNVLGLKSWDFARFAGMDPDEKIRAIVAAAHEQGAVVSINHFPWSTGGVKPRWKPGTHLTREDAVAHGFDLLEVANWDDDIAPIDEVSWEFCKSHPIAPVAATDVHVPEKDRMHAWTLLSTREFTEAAVMDELRARRTTVVFKPGGVPYPVKHKENPAYTFIKPLAQIGQAFVSLHAGGSLGNLDKRGVAAWVLHACLLFVLVELACVLR